MRTEGTANRRIGESANRWLQSSPSRRLAVSPSRSLVVGRPSPVVTRHPLLRVELDCGYGPPGELHESVGLIVAPPREGGTRVAALGLEPGILPRSASTPASEALIERCAAQLRQIHQSIVAYQREKGQLPDRLSDLYPRYVTDTRLFHCPADASPGRQGMEGKMPPWLTPTADPKLSVSYSYPMCGAEYRTAYELPGGAILPAAGPVLWTWRKHAMAQRRQFGDRVPMVRCWHHTGVTVERSIPRRRDQGLASLGGQASSSGVPAALVIGEPIVQSLTLGGQIYRGPGSWEHDPETVLVLLDRMTQDLAADPDGSIGRWSGVVTGGYFTFLPSRPGLRERVRAVADRMASLVQRTPRRYRDLPQVHSAIGSLYTHAGDTHRAIAAFQRVIDRLSTGRFCRNGEMVAARTLPGLYRSVGRRDRAIAVYERMHAKNPEIDDWAQALAAEYAAMGHQKKAAEWGRKAGPGARP